MKRYLIVISALLCLSLTGCPEHTPSSDEVEQHKQDQILADMTKQVGMPNIVTFREKRMLKTILELRDQEGFLTYSYLWNEMQGKLIYLGQTIGYGIPYATQYTNPSKVERFKYYDHYGTQVLPQADPNGLFSPQSAEGTWLLMKDPNSDKTVPMYVEPRVIVSPFPIPGAVDLQGKPVAPFLADAKAEK